MRPLAILLTLIFASVVSAQHFEQLPDFRSHYDPSRIYTVAAGETRTLPVGDVDLVWIEGHCTVPRNGDLDLRVREIIVAPTGWLDMGTESDPVLGNVTITFADGSTFDGDPGQWGTGLICAGKWTACGLDRERWIETTSDISGSAVPLGANWQPGDLIGLPDTKIVHNRNIGGRYRQDAPYILTENGSLDRELSFSRVARTYASAIVANLSSNITFRSENPLGVRGHTLITDNAEAALCNVAFVEMGRTRPGLISDTNRTGRYPVHAHHCNLPFTFRRLAVIDSYRTKWGITVHNSSWGTVEECVVTGVVGAGIVTEEGQEVGNRIQRNLVWDIPGNRAFPHDFNEGFRGSGYWLKGISNYFDDNVAMNCAVGCQTAVIRGPAGAGQETPGKVPVMFAPAFPGGPRSLEITSYQTSLSAQRNRFVSNGVGLDTWGPHDSVYLGGVEEINRPPYGQPNHWKECTFAYNGSRQVEKSWTMSSDLFENCTFIGHPTLGGHGISGFNGYAKQLYLDGCLFADLTLGTITSRSTVIRNCLFDCDKGIQGRWIDSSSWIFGLTVEDNQFAAIDIVFDLEGVTLDTLDPSIVTLEELYANIESYRQYITAGGDPNAAERARLLAEIEAAEQQIEQLQELIMQLQIQLDGL